MHTSQGLFDGVFGRGAVDTSDQAWLQAMLDTEAALARALEQAGMAPPGAGAAVTAAARAEAFDAAELGRQAALTGNPVPALVRALTRTLPAGPAGAVHQGATSQDIIDTAAMLLARQSLGVISDDLAAAAAAAARLAAVHRDTIMIGRTLLQQAVPVTFGLVAAGWLTGLDEAATALDRVAASRLAVQFGGAAGTLSALGGRGPEVAALLAAELGLRAPTLPWHTDRLRITEIAGACAGVTGVLSKIARDVTLLAQSEVGEVAEGGGERRGGSSAMPQKRNPVASIAVLGCTRQVPGLVATLVAAAEQEHQRAAGAWHAEWEPLADLLRLTGSAASWAADLLGGLEPDPGPDAAQPRCGRRFPDGRARRVAAGARAGPHRRPRPAGGGQRRRRRGGPDAGRGAGGPAGRRPARRGRGHPRAGHRRPGPGRVPGCGRGVRGRGPGRAHPGRQLGFLAGAASLR